MIEHSNGSGPFTGQPGTLPASRTAVTSAKESFFVRPRMTRTSMAGSLGFTASLVLSEVPAEVIAVESAGTDVFAVISLAGRAVSGDGRDESLFGVDSGRPVSACGR